MPWYEPCASNGYTKFYQNPQLREDRWVVSDGYLQSLLTAYRQGYVNAGGPDYEDSDDALLNTLAENCVGNTSGAASLGAAHAARDKAAGQDYHPQSLSPGGAIPVTAPRVDVQTSSTGAAGAEAAAIYTTAPAGQPEGVGYTGAPVITPSPSTSGPASAFGYGPLGAGTAVSSPGGITSSPGIPWLLIAAVAAGAFFLLRKK